MDFTIRSKSETTYPEGKTISLKKFDDGQLHGIRWEPEAVVSEMEHSKHQETGAYLFDLSELVEVSTVRSFFSWQKASKVKSNNSKPSTFENNIPTTDEQLTDEENLEDEAFQEQLAIDLEIHSADIRQIMNQMDMSENNSSTSTSKRVLSSLENESNTKKSSRFPRRKIKIRTHYFPFSKDEHCNIVLFWKHQA